MATLMSRRITGRLIKSIIIYLEKFVFGNFNEVDFFHKKSFIVILHYYDLDAKHSKFVCMYIIAKDSDKAIELSKEYFWFYYKANCEVHYIKEMPVGGITNQVEIIDPY